MPDIDRGNRPLSPFMIGQYYKPQMTSMSSILVRITGIALLIFSIVLVAWLLAGATSPQAFSVIDGILTSVFGKIVMLISAWALYYHALGRLRHVVWDFGYCLDVDVSEKLGLGMFVLATILTLLTAVVAFTV